MTIFSRYEELHPMSRKLHERAAALFPDGVTHDARHETPFPLYVERAAGSRKWDVDGNEIIDYVMGHGSLLLGHQHPAVVDAVSAQAQRGTHYGASHEAEIRWGELVTQLVPSAERLRFTSSGTEATMMAVRLARSYTGREKILRLREHFHGWNDSVTGQPAAEETVPSSSPGLPRGIVEASIVIEPNDADQLERTLRDDGHQIAAMIFEATGAHFGAEQLDLDYVRRARDLTRERGVVMIMDEVVTCFRIAPGGAQQAYGLIPDMTTMAKVLGGGLPGGAVAGRAEIIDQIAMGPGGTRRDGQRRVEHPGTYNANPLSAAAGVAALTLAADGSHQKRAADTAANIARGMNAVFREESIAGCVYGQSSILHVAPGMTQQPPDGYSWGWRALPVSPPPAPRETAHALRLGMLNEGVHVFGDLMLVSSAHTDDDVTRTIDAFRATLRAMKDENVLSIAS
jgi:glutamate-1-semialdehyde 2,1-aminomutase